MLQRRAQGAPQAVCQADHGVRTQGLGSEPNESRKGEREAGDAGGAERVEGSLVGTRGTLNAVKLLLHPDMLLEAVLVKHVKAEQNTRHCKNIVAKLTDLVFSLFLSAKTSDYPHA